MRPVKLFGEIVVDGYLLLRLEIFFIKNLSLVSTIPTRDIFIDEKKKKRPAWR